MPGLNGLEVLQWAREFYQASNVASADMPKVAFCSSFMPTTIQQKLCANGVKVSDLLEKPMTLRRLRRYLRSIGYDYRRIAHN